MYISIIPAVYSIFAHNFLGNINFARVKFVGK